MKDILNRIFLKLEEFRPLSTVRVLSLIEIPCILRKKYLKNEKYIFDVLRVLFFWAQESSTKEHRGLRRKFYFFIDSFIVKSRCNEEECAAQDSAR